MINRFEKFSYSISEIYRYWHKIAAKEMEKYGLKGPYAVYFTTLYQYPEGITSAKLADLCGRDKSDVSRAIALLEKKALITKESVNQNFYRALIKLTDEGKSLAEHINEKAEIAVEQASRGITAEDRKIFYNVTELIISNLRVLSKEGFSQGGKNEH